MTSHSHTSGNPDQAYFAAVLAEGPADRHAAKQANKLSDIRRRTRSRLRRLGSEGELGRRIERVAK